MYKILLFIASFFKISIECQLKIVDARPSVAWTVFSFQSYFLRFLSLGLRSTFLTAVVA